MWVGHVYHGKHWTFEIKLITARKTETFGTEFSGVTQINIADGLPFVESLHADEFTKADYRELKEFITQILLFKTYEYSRYDCDLTRKKIKK